MKNIWVNKNGIYEYILGELTNLGFATIASFGVYLEETFGLSKGAVLRGPDVDVVNLHSGGKTLLFILSQTGEHCLRAKDIESNELLKDIAQSLESLRIRT